MIPTTTGGIAHGTSASERAIQRPRRFVLSRSASPSASANWTSVTLNAQMKPILNELTKRLSWIRRWKFASPTQCVVTLKPACASVKPR